MTQNIKQDSRAFDADKESQFKISWNYQISLILVIFN